MNSICIFRSKKELSPIEIKEYAKTFCGEDAYALSEQKDRSPNLVRLSDLETLGDSGRAFSIKAELRWERGKEGFVALLLPQLPKEPGAEFEILGEYQWLTASFDIQLWGSWEEGAWFEARIPRTLVYPIDSPSRKNPCLKAKLLGKDGIPQFLVLEKVEEVEEKGK